MSADETAVILDALQAIEIAGHNNDALTISTNVSVIKSILAGTPLADEPESTLAPPTAQVEPDSTLTPPTDKPEPAAPEVDSAPKETSPWMQ